MIDLFSLSQIVAMMNLLDENLREAHVVGLMESVVLCSLGREIESPSAISKATGIGVSNLSRILRGLEERKFIERNIADSDKRKLRFTLTVLGHKTLEAIEGSGIDIPEGLLVICQALEKR